MLRAGRNAAGTNASYLTVEEFLAGNTVSSPYRYLLIEPAPEFDVWLGETRVTGLNMRDVLGDGTVSYDPNEDTLTFTANAPAITGVHEDALIYAMGYLRIEAPNGLTLNSPDGFGILVVPGTGSGGLTVNGDLTANTKWDAVWAYGDIYLYGDVDVTMAGTPRGTGGISMGDAGVCSNSGKVYISQNAQIRVTDPSSDMPGIVALSGSISVGGDLTVTTPATYGLLTLTGTLRPLSGCWDITAGVAAIRAGGIDLSLCAVAEPVGGRVTRVVDGVAVPDDAVPDTGADVYYSIVDTDGNVAPHVVLAPVYIRLGDVPVTDLNCADPLGDGTASYDTDTRTLTFTTDTPDIPGGEFCEIQSNGSLTIEAPGTLTLNNAFGSLVFCDADLTLRCGLAGTFGGNALSCFGQLQLQGGADLTYAGDVACTSTTIYCGTLIVFGDLDIVTLTTENVVTAGWIDITGDVNIDNSYLGDYVIPDPDTDPGVIIVIDPHDACCLYAQSGYIRIYGSALLKTDGTCAVSAGDFITLEHGRWDITATTGRAVYALDQISYPVDCEITTPAGGVCVQLYDGSTYYWTITEPDMSTNASHVVIESPSAAVTLSFDACGGTVSPASLEIVSGAPIGSLLGELPTPTRSGGWGFLGWYLEPAATQFDVGQATPVTAETTFDADATVYAHWRMPGDVNGDGKVTVAD
ncbi:MAG: InlB B-repeat-containing protein, partial [Oscillospiraceae bacterium]|nr:InlB B-repeat-containing protein [Oscillospiraceae bacterium]